MTEPIVIPDGVLDILGRHFRRGRDAALEWIQKPIPACGDLSPIDWVRAGHTWNEVEQPTGSAAHGAQSMSVDTRIQMAVDRIHAGRKELERAQEHPDPVEQRKAMAREARGMITLLVVVLKRLHRRGEQRDNDGYPYDVCMECRAAKGWPCPTRILLDAEAEPGEPAGREIPGVPDAGFRAPNPDGGPTP